MYPFPLQRKCSQWMKFVYLWWLRADFRVHKPQIYTTAETEETRGLYRFSSYSGRASVLKRVTSSWLLSEVAIGASRSTSSRERRMEQEADRGRVYYHSAAYRPGATTSLSYRSELENKMNQIIFRRYFVFNSFYTISHHCHKDKNYKSSRSNSVSYRCWHEVRQSNVTQHGRVIKSIRAIVVCVCIYRSHAIVMSYIKISVYNIFPLCKVY